VQILHFQYLVSPGDSADPLEYNTERALTGHLLRFSTRNPSIVANLILPAPFGLGSLGFCCNVVIESEAPFVESIMPLKRAGVYGEMEVIYIMVRFSKPVQVEGVPQLLLRVNATTGVGVANYTATMDEYDIPIDIRSTDAIFKYVVRQADNVLSLVHTDAFALQLPDETAAIKHLTNSPTLSADLSLRDPSDQTPIDGRVYRQWKFRYPASVEVLLRDLYHTKPDSITATVEHNGYTATLFESCCEGRVFGNSYPKTRSGTNATLRSVDTGVGDDFLFSDITAPNIAQLGIVSQSSTRISAKRAIDGNVDPLVGDNSVSETQDEQDAWWLLQLPTASSVRAMTLWARKPQSWVYPVVEMVVKSYDKFPEGRFRLNVSNIDDSDPTFGVLTGYIDMGASPVSMQSVIEATPGLGNVLVTRKQLPPCENNGQGCGVGFDSGYGFAYRLNFLSLRASTPTVYIVDVEFPGEAEAAQLAAIGVDVNTRPFQLSAEADLIREGTFIEVPEEPEYGKGVTPPPLDANEDTSNTGAEFNTWLTPFWLFVFSDATAPPAGLNDSISASIWHQRYENMGDLLNVNLPEAMSATYIKVQREGTGSLSLAEFEVYEERINSMRDYIRGTPIQPSPLTSPYQPIEPFKHTFSNTEIDGRWLVQLTQNTDLGRHQRGWFGALGSISEAVLIVTDLAGVVHSYYQDLRAEVTSLPTYGSLRYTTARTESPYGNWREAFEVSDLGELRPRLGGERYQGYCYGPDTSGNVSTQDVDQTYTICPNNFDVRPLLSSSRLLGDTPERVFLRNERVVVYHPKEGYLGPDYFTYIVYDGLGVQVHEYAGGSVDSRNEVTVHVRRCRPFQSAIQRAMNASISTSFKEDGEHVLCDCAQTETSLINNQTICDAARVAVCSSATAGVSGAFVDAVAGREHFLAMCSTCFDPQQGLRSGQCQTQTIRAVSLLTSRGLCRASTGEAAEPVMDCSTETVTEPGREATNYLSLKPPMLYGSFERLKNSFGAYGWYHTPRLT